MCVIVAGGACDGHDMVMNVLQRGVKQSAVRREVPTLHEVPTLDEDMKLACRALLKDLDA